MTQETSYDTVFGRMAVDHGLCTQEELAQSLRQFKAMRQNGPIMLRDLLVQMGYLTKYQAQRLHANIKENKASLTQIPGYRIEGKLGSGAMAVVYKAKQLSLDRTVAIKVLPKRFSENAEYVKRFYQEGRAAGKLHHSNIVQAIDVGEANGKHFFVMEYVRGKTIADDLTDGPVYEESQALDIILQVARALDHAHSIGLIHRDVKPKNIMITEAGEVKLADMGLARETADIETAKSEEGKAYGTPYYIAPEQIRGKIDIDGRADIYGLGATFYHMVTGRVPFMADDSAEIMRKHLRERLIPPDHINTNLSAGVSEVIELMMAKDRNERYHDVKELIADLEALREGNPPMQARSRFDVSTFEKLEEGDTVEDASDVDQDEVIARYRVVCAILGTVSAVSIVVILMMAVMNAG